MENPVTRGVIQDLGGQIEGDQVVWPAFTPYDVVFHRLLTTAIKLAGVNDHLLARIKQLEENQIPVGRNKLWH